MANRKKPEAARKGAPPPEAMTGMGERLDRAMRSKKPRMTQNGLSDKAGVSQSAISDMINGNSLDGVTAVFVARVCIALDVSPSWLLLGIGDIIPPLSAASAFPISRNEGEHALVPAAATGSSAAGKRE